MEEIVGRGGHGTIYATSNTQVRKEACNSTDCFNNKREYKLQKKAYEAVKLFDGIEMIKVLNPSEWNETYRTNEQEEVCCSYNMNRIYSPDGEGQIWQAYLYAYNPDMDKTSSGSDYIRGRYVGKNKIKELFEGTQYNLENISYFSGILLGSVQFGSEQTAVDTELILGSDYEGKIALYLIDYDRSSFWKEDNPETGLPFTKRQLVFNLTKPMEDEEFYPGKDDEELYSYFLKGYYDSARHFNQLELAESVISMRESMDVF